MLPYPIIAQRAARPIKAHKTSAANSRAGKLM